MSFIIFILIAVVADYFLLHTFPTWTFITLLSCILIFLIKLYVNRREDIVLKKQIALFFQKEYEYVEPMLKHLSEEEIELIKPFAFKTSIDIEFEEKIKYQQIIMKGFYQYINIVEYPGIPQPFFVIKSLGNFQLILQKYFKQ